MLGRASGWRMIGFQADSSLRILQARSNTAIDPDKLRKARSIYYEIMGWDEQGIPNEVKLEELDIG